MIEIGDAVEKIKADHEVGVDMSTGEVHNFDDRRSVSRDCFATICTGYRQGRRVGEFCQTTQ